MKMDSNIRTITAEDLESVVQGINYAVVKQSKSLSGNINLFVKIDGKEITADTESAWTVSQYRDIHKGMPNAILYDCGKDGVELVVKYPNGFGLSAISTPRIKGGRGCIEVAIKCGKMVTYGTPVADDFLEDITLDELVVIMNHVSHIDPSGMEYVADFVPEERYKNKSVLREVFKWYKVGKNFMLK
jgi:hypothetical protein